MMSPELHTHQTRQDVVLKEIHVTVREGRRGEERGGRGEGRRKEREVQHAQQNTLCLSSPLD